MKMSKLVLFVFFPERAEAYLLVRTANRCVEVRIKGLSPRCTVHKVGEQKLQNHAWAAVSLVFINN
jgi:hypothetical protein